MKSYQVRVTGVIPGRYRGLLGASEHEAVEKAQTRHKAAGFPVDGHIFAVASSFTVIGPVVESDVDTTHALALTDGQLAEVEAALLDRIDYLTARLNMAQRRPSPAQALYQAHLKAARSALDLVVSA
jgi:hypothetical protein